MILNLKYWFKRWTGIKVRNEAELLEAIEKVRGNKPSICILEPITLSQSLVLPPTTMFLYAPLRVKENVKLVLNGKGENVYSCQ